MEKKSRNSMYNKLNIKDILVIILSILALIMLILVVKHSNEEKERLQQELNQISNSVQVDGLTYEEKDTLNYLQFSEIGQEGFVEFTNTGNRDISVSGYRLVANGEEICLAEGTVIAPDEFLVIEMESAFPTDGDTTIRLYDAKDRLILHMETPAVEEGYSYAKLSTTNMEYGILSPTKGQWNGYLLAMGYDELTFSVPSGCYNEDFYLSMYAPGGSTIYYTLDGTTPTPESEKYTDAILLSNTSGSNVVYAAQASAGNDTFLPTSITKATVVKAICVDKAGVESEVYTQTYLMGLKHATDLQDMPIISISIEPEDLFDYYEGIYIKGRSFDDALALGMKTTGSANFYNGWTKDVVVEYFESCKGRSFVGEATIEVVNDYSAAAAQKSFLLRDIDTAVCGETSLSEYFSADGSVLLQTNKRDNIYKVREYLATALLQDAAVGVPQLSPCAVFIDGEYWGCYMLRRPYDAAYVAENYGVEEESVEISVKGEAENHKVQQQLDDLYEYVITTDMSKSANYKTAEKKMDMQSYAEYLCANIYLANSDFGLENWTVWRSSDQTSDYGDKKWRWVMPEIDSSMDNGTVSKLTGYRIDSFLMPAFSQDYFVQSLLRNDTFCTLVCDTMLSMMEGCFAYENVEPVIDELAARMNKPVISNYKRFNGYPAETLFTAEVEKIKTFFMERGSYMSVYVHELKDTRGMYVEASLPLVLEELEMDDVEQ